jgi:alginate O-acetyltransferase complex protein AlgJ
LARGNDRLAGKKLVIYEFAVRDLSGGDWKLLDLPTPKPTPPPVSLIVAAKDTATPLAPPSSGAATPVPPPAKSVAPVPPAPPKLIVKPAAGKSLVVRGVIKSVAPIPKPGSVPYKDCVIGVVLQDVTAVQGTAPGKEALVYMWGMQDNRLSRASGYRAGQTAIFTLTPWSKVEERYGGYNRVEPDDAEAMLLEAYWAE